MPRVFENKLNVLLSELLNRMGVVSRSEQLNRGRRDVVVYSMGVRIVLEGSYSKVDAERDAEKRIEQLQGDIAIAIHYKEEYPQELSEHEIKERLKESSFDIKIVVPKDVSETLLKYLHRRKVLPKPVSGWMSVDIGGLAEIIKESTQFIIAEEDMKSAQKKIGKFICDFAEILESDQHTNKIAQNIYDVLLRLYGFSIGNPQRIKEVLFAQAGLALLLSSIYYETIRHKHKKASLKELQEEHGPRKALEEAYIEILKINYQPIFNVAKEIIECIPSLRGILARLIDIAGDIASKRTLLRKDLAGKVYHKIVGEWSLKKGLATFFTSIPAAYLLLYLMEPQCEVKIMGDKRVQICFDVPRICDFACGSGTLLTAAYSATMTNLAEKLIKTNIDFDPTQIYGEFHRKFIENCYGFDVLKYATQITALNLAFHNPEEPLERFNIFALPLGVRKKGDTFVSLGSLEFLGTTEKLTNILGITQATRIGIEKEVKETIKISDILSIKFDYIVMNPPFTRATGRGGKEGGGLFGFVMDENLRDNIVRAYKSLLSNIKVDLLNKAKILLKNSDLEFLLNDKNFQSFRAIGYAGMGLPFLFLAYRMIKEDGKIGFVLPKSLLSGISWFLARVLLLSEFHPEYIIVSYDSEEGYNFSESTSLSELLLVARKTRKHSDDEKTRFVILLKKPKTSIEAIALAREIKTADQMYVEAGNAQAFILSVNRRKLLKHIGNWGRFVSFPHIYLIEKTFDIMQSILQDKKQKFMIPITKFNDLILSIGISRTQFHEYYKVISREIPGRLPVIYGGEERIRTKMLTSPNAYVIPKSRKAQQVFKEKKGLLLLPDRIRINTTHVISMLSKIPTLANIFYVVRLKNENENKLKALCLWFNTTWGLLTVLANRDETEGGWFQLKIGHWRLTPVLDVDKLEQERIDVLNKLAKIFDKFANVDMGRIPEQYNPHKINKNRLSLDKEFLRAFGYEIEDNELIELYKHIYEAFKQWLG